MGDALGAPVEFMRRAEILQRFGPDGITAYAPAYGVTGAITDDTQMTLFTAEGLLRAYVRGCCKGVTTYSGVTAHAYLRWLRTQGETPPLEALGDGDDGWLFQYAALHSRRAPGNTCLAALRAMTSPGRPAGNGSKGCGGVMRMAPAGLFTWRAGRDPEAAFRLGLDLAALTHGHPTGHLTAGAFAAIVHALLDGASLPASVDVARQCLRTEPSREETLRALDLAQELSETGAPQTDAFARLGQGWIAEEALAIGVYSALVVKDFRSGVILAVNHDGDSDSTGSIAGNILGTMLGADAIPSEWLDGLELREAISEIAADLHEFPSWDIHGQSVPSRVWTKYPGS